MHATQQGCKRSAEVQDGHALKKGMWVWYMRAVEGLPQALQWLGSSTTSSGAAYRCISALSAAPCILHVSCTPVLLRGDYNPSSLALVACVQDFKYLLTLRPIARQN